MSTELSGITVKKSQIMKMVEAIRKQPNDTDIPFEFVFSALFPNMLDNINKAMQDNYTKGYVQGRNDTNNENSGN